MVTEASNIAFGIGLYSPGQAAYLARVPVQTITRWVHGSTSGRAAIRPQLADDPERTVTFLDLVQTLAIRSIRLAKRVPLPKIRQCIEVAATEYGVEYPFARKHQTYLFDDDIVLRLADDRLVQVTGKYQHNDLIKQVAEIYMEDLHFSPEGLADRYTPLVVGDRKVVVDPRIRFGQPMVMPCGYSVEALLTSVESEGSIDRAAEVNRADREDVVLALRYDDILAGMAPREALAG